MLPSLVRDHINDVLAQPADYTGRVEDVDLNLWRGAYSIKGVRIVKSTARLPVPFVDVQRIDISVDWSSLLNGTVRGKLRLDTPQVHFVDGPTPAESQSGAHQPWLAMMRKLFPFRLDKVELVDGEVHFQAFHERPSVDVYLTDLHLTVSNLTNVQNTVDPLLATVTGRAKAMDSGRVELDMRLNPDEYRPTFELAAKLVDMDVTKLNSMARAYGGFDFEGGRFDFVVELTARDGLLDGYAKPLFRDATILGPDDVRKNNPLEFIWQSLAGAVGTVLTNPPRDQFGTRFAIRGDLDDPRTSVLEIVLNTLRNAFVQAYLPNLEGNMAPQAASSRPRRTETENP
ncbi:MAG TPA: DUF748 domain-containing protein [Phycisphaerales bacterium]